MIRKKTVDELKSEMLEMIEVMMVEDGLNLRDIKRIIISNYKICKVCLDLMLKDTIYDGPNQVFCYSEGKFYKLTNFNFMSGYWFCQSIQKIMNFNKELTLMEAISLFFDYFGIVEDDENIKTAGNILRTHMVKAWGLQSVKPHRKDEATELFSRCFIPYATEIRKNNYGHKKDVFHFNEGTRKVKMEIFGDQL